MGGGFWKGERGFGRGCGARYNNPGFVSEPDTGLRCGPERTRLYKLTRCVKAATRTHFCTRACTTRGVYHISHPAQAGLLKTRSFFTTSALLVPAHVVAGDALRCGRWSLCIVRRCSPASQTLRLQLYELYVYIFCASPSETPSIVLFFSLTPSYTRAPLISPHTLARHSFLSPPHSPVQQANNALLR